MRVQWTDFAPVRAIGIGLAFGLVACGTESAAGPSHHADGGNTPDSGASPAGGAGNGGSPGGASGGSSAAGGRGGTTGGSGGMTGTGGNGGAVTAPPSSWVNATGNLAGMTSECGNLTLVSAKPGSTLVIAGVAHVGLYGTTDSGKSWQKLGAGAGSDSIINRPSSIVYDPDHPDVFWESGIYNSGGVYKTTDGGQTFKQLGNITHNDVVSVDFTDPARQTLLAGGHEQKQTLYLSTDGGQNWSNIGKNLPADSHFSSFPLLIDAKTQLLGACGYGSGACGVYRSTDGGQGWSKATDLSAAARPLWAADGSIYWPLIYDSGLAKSVDQGQSFSQIIQYGPLTTATPVELPDSRIVAPGPDHLQISADGGKTFTPILDPLPFKTSGVAYSVETKTFFIWHWDCNGVVLSDAIASAGFDYTKG